MGNVISMPIAAAVGGTHVSLAQCAKGDWAVMVWERKEGPRMVGRPTSYSTAVKAATALAERLGAIVDLPEGFGLMHVQRSPDGELHVLHESPSGGSFALLKVFGPHEREDAVLFAMSRLYHYQPCRLGEVAAWHS